MKPRRNLQDRLAGRRALLGLFQRHPNPALAEIAGLCGYDFLVLDDEHGVFNEADHLQALRATSFCDMAIFVRLRGHDLRAIGRYLDLGVDGILVPDVATLEQAQELARAMEYPPAGTRGMGAAAHRATRYGMDIAAHLQAPRAGVSLIVLIESAQGVENVEGICAVDGVDGVVIGPSDLAANLGVAGDFASPAYADAIIRIERAAAAQGKILGTAPHPGYPLETLHTRGHRFLILGSETALIREAMSAQLAQARSLFEGSGK